MNELLQQFLIESRELIESASDGLTTIEQASEDNEQLDAVLRALHTLKGGAGIVNFAPMERTMHAAEDILGAARNGKRPVTPREVAHCLACLDQALRWLEILEQTGELPRDAAEQADGIISRLGLPVEDVAETSGPKVTEQLQPGWLRELLSSHATARAQAATAVRFVPAMDSFYRSEDPLARMMSVPGLVALDCAPSREWGAIGALDPFACNITLTALSTAPIADVRAHLKGHSGECQIVPVNRDRATESSERLFPAPVAKVIKAQRLLLDGDRHPDFIGRVGSAGLVAANALRFCGRSEQAHAIAGATERSLLERSVRPLQQALAELFNPTTSMAEAGVASARPLNQSARTVRVDAERVDALVRLAGELTVLKNSMGHVVKLALAGDPTVPQVLKDRHAGLERLVGELQRSVLAIRVVPLRTVLRRFPRIVREISASLGKAVSLTIEGDDTEADKTIVEMLFEPLLHIVRNAIDHGVETPKVRTENGKPDAGSLRIRAQRQSDQVLVEVSDDGAGIDVARVREIARTRGIATEELLRTMAEPDVIELIFAPGFSTAAQVTELSGRGVGMDAVRRAVERVGGKVSVLSRMGQGTTVKLSLPFSVMMTHVMTVEAGGQIFGLPMEAVVETARVPQAAIAHVGSGQAVVLRNRTVPLVDLAASLGLGLSNSATAEATVVVVVANGAWGGIRVDRVLERLDLILKPLDGLLLGTPGVAGTTLLGDGRVLLVLDIGEILQ